MHECVHSMTCFVSAHSDLSLEQHEYVKQCQKLRTDVKLVLADKPSDQHSLDHTLPEGEKAASDSSCCISHEEANSLLNSYLAKEHRLRCLLESKDQIVRLAILGLCSVSYILNISNVCGLF